ncbi:Rrf2 family transcriptional regulator [Citrobacter freundii]|uniref:RrF2 family transcriptional regulator n=1 Tax=Citrobacter TaxID=544 RepID=UPI0024E04C02|nr:MULTISPECIES: Rrf2 family transcriptional regulator [Citrobacter]MDM3102012.1 Rrf2 family transcriptional regulator [Citrobacter sp. Cf134]MDV0485639.1 Rrf2 family transcriptional regulator [Citrobacter freundii]MDV0490668.1 Rrf2 family transcriptional regulator [Citrobacter freundii]MDV0495724.1 Rrf2 family transcriptional regulator [Citrobacter freundii]MDV0500651.1 Rrf2 family transcriptional regulator [Citrobacter freundii]
MEFGMKRVVASVQVVAILNRIYNGSPVSVASISKESKLSVSYLEQIFSKLRRSEIVTSQRGAGGGYHLSKANPIVRAVTHTPDSFEPVLNALEWVPVAQLVQGKSPTP